jgi:hypothetical protein
LKNLHILRKSVCSSFYWQIHPKNNYPKVYLHIDESLLKEIIELLKFFKKLYLKVAKLTHKEITISVRCVGHYKKHKKKAAHESTKNI